MVNDEGRPSYQIVGVSKDARTQQLRDDIAPRFFVPAKEPSSAVESPTFLIRTVSDAALVMNAVQKTIQRVDANVPIISAETLEERMAPLTGQDRAVAQLAIAFGSVALLLAAIGLYGVLSHGIARRTGEIAIRIALGAESRRVIAMILRETIGLVGVGLVLGAILVDAASRIITSRLYGVDPEDPLTLAFATGLLLVVAFMAALLPAQRASKVDPMAALRQS
jgi:ABC-type antimicrobial peptide transport system permease subunit